ncbi:MAG TPA: cytochrome c oxidase subunit 3 [Thermoleophilaceae bacterium]|jgi:cytochrome c oxidase subunit 3|nr:cytochrome c oxidase subunit 3 [Thermoleophilaceae bacterium]
MESASVAHAHEEHLHPPAANVSSRVEAQFLGMLLFIISEIMIFGAFFTAYFFIRVVANAKWPAPGMHIPVSIAAVNTAILLSSSFTMHWALTGVRNENRFALKAGVLTTFCLGLTFLSVQVNEYVHLGFAPHDHAQGTIFYCLTGLHGAHVFVGLTLLAIVTTRAFRGHYTAKEHRGVEVPGIYWHFVDIMWIFVFSSLYVL